ncbi:MAG TPA: hypothetical protein VNJ08_12130 [Bacteriovoracaceae bacterium]|nr:hypothetical protein [Bacteriovoracaceae bacterium]
MKYIFFLTLAFSALSEAWSQTSYIPATRVLHDKGHQVVLGADIFQTASVINSDGTRHALTSDQTFTRYQGEVGGQYGLTRALQIGMAGRFRYHQSTFLDAAGDNVTATSSGLQSIATTILYAFDPVGSLTYTLEGMFRYTPYTNAEFTPGSSQTNLILGDDGNEYAGGLGVTYTFASNNFLTARTGYRKPGLELSDEIYWQGEGALVWQYVALVAGVDGVTSLEGDPYKNINRPVFNTGTSALYNTSNREWIAPYVGLNIAFNHQWRVELRGGQVVDGQSTDLGRSFGVQLIRRVEESPTKLVDTRFKSYDIEATITKVSPEKAYVVIDKGLADDIQKGMGMDFYEFDYVGGNVLVARGTVLSVKADSAVVKITQRFNQKKEIKEGLIGRAMAR